MSRLCALLLVALAACSGSPFRNDGPTTQLQAREIEGEVWSPYCPGRLLADCTTAQSQELRAEISRRLMEEGSTKSEILDWISAEFGAAAIAEPPASGRGLVIWMVPALVFLAGGLIVAATIRRWRRSSGVVTGAPPLP